MALIEIEMFVCFQKEVEDGAMITSTVYIPSQGKLACGRSNGTIIILPATLCIMLQILENRMISHESEL